MEQGSESEYIKRIINGESNLFSHFVNQYGHGIFLLIKQIVPSQEDAEELVQDVFVKAFDKLHTFKGDAAFSTWIYRIAYNMAVSMVRKKKRIFPYFDENEIQHISDESVNHYLNEENDEELLVSLENALNQLEVEERLLISFYYMEEKPVREIASIMQLSTENVKVRLHRIRKKLFVLVTKSTKNE